MGALCVDCVLVYNTNWAAAHVSIKTMRRRRRASLLECNGFSGYRVIEMSVLTVCLCLTPACRRSPPLLAASMDLALKWGVPSLAELM